MITKVSSLTALGGYSVQKSKEQNNQNTLIPITSPILSSYSVNNLKANFMPLSSNISFGAQVPAKQKPLIQNMKYLEESEKIKGEYYNSFSDDLAILIGSEKDVVLTARNGVNPEILAHNFSNRIEKGKYGGMGLTNYDSEVMYIENPAEVKVAYRNALRRNSSQNDYVNPSSVSMITVLDDINLNSSEDSPKVVFINNFEECVNDIKNEVVNNMGYNASNASKIVVDVNEYLALRYSNLHIVGVVSDKIFEKPKEGSMASMMGGNPMAKDLGNFSRLELKGLSTSQTKEFFKKNPSYINNVLDIQQGTKLKISDGALSNLVEKSAVKMDMALPAAAEIALKRLSYAKVNETENLKPGSSTTITTKDVDNFFDRHSLVMEEFKPEAGTFTIAENVKTKLSDVGGISSIKQDIQDDLIAYLKNPKQFTEERGVAPKGVLLEGPPGTGKTLLARAIAGETNTPFISASGSEFVEMYVGVGAKRVRELFASARAAAENSPNHTAIVFIDEFDALARARSNNGGGGEREAEQTLNQLLTEMDGFNNKESKTKVVVIAATNRKDMLDKAAIRPGRFDDVFTVGNPRSAQDRLEIMNIHAKGLKFASEEDKAKILAETAKLTEGMSGAELAGIMNRAKRVVAKRDGNKFVTYNDMIEGYLQTIAGPVQKNTEERPIEDIIETVRHEGGHATVIDFLAPLLGDKVSFITLDQRGNFLGAVFRKPSEMSPTFRSVILSAAVGYAGGIAEPEYDKQGRSAGVSQDVSQATRLFRKAITEWGQGVYTPPITMVPNSHENSADANAFYDTMRKVNEKNIAKDVALFSATAGAIATLVNNFHKGFLDEYMESFKANAGKGGNSLSGEEFSKLRQAWIHKNGKETEAKRLLAKIDRMLDSAMNKNTNVFKRVVKKVTKSI